MKREVFDLWSEVAGRYCHGNVVERSASLLQLLDDPRWERWYRCLDSKSMEDWQIEQLQKLLGPYGPALMKVLQLKKDGLI